MTEKTERTPWPDPGRFLSATGILEGGGKTVEQMTASLDAANYWPEPWSVARKRAHVRWMMRTCMDAEGRPRFLEVGPPDVLPPDATIGDEQQEGFAHVIDYPTWQTLEQIRQHLLTAGLLEPSEPELDQVQLLEHLLGTEEKLPALSLMRKYICCVIDPDAVDPEPVYKVIGTHWTEEDTLRARRFLEMKMAERRDTLRALKLTKEEAKKFKDHLGPDVEGGTHGTTQ